MPKQRIPHWRLGLLKLLVLTLLFTGCAGYQLGQRSLYRPDIRTVYVPIARSDSYRRNLGEQLTEMVVKEIELRTPYKVVGNDAADSVLNLRIVAENKQIRAETQYDDVRDLETNFFVQMSWADRRGDLIMSQNDIPVQPLLVNISQSANFVPEAGQSLLTAHQDALHGMAQQIVNQMELAW
jgi:hypothetical protein